jgi:hypothetical protein
MDCANGEMNGVFGGFLGNGSGNKECLCQLIHTFIYRKKWYGSEQSDAFRGSASISPATFDLGELGCHQFKG